jgi:hypothetical protein
MPSPNSDHNMTLSDYEKYGPDATNVEIDRGKKDIGLRRKSHDSLLEDSMFVNESDCPINRLGSVAPLEPM